MEQREGKILFLMSYQTYGWQFKHTRYFFPKIKIYKIWFLKTSMLPYPPKSIFRSDTSTKKGFKKWQFKHTRYFFPKIKIYKIWFLKTSMLPYPPKSIFRSDTSTKKGFKKWQTSSLVWKRRSYHSRPGLEVFNFLIWI